MHKVCKVNAGDCFDDNNGGLIYGLQDYNEPCDYVEWFATELERDNCIKENNMVVVE